MQPLRQVQAAAGLSGHLLSAAQHPLGSATAWPARPAAAAPPAQAPSPHLGLAARLQLAAGRLLRLQRTHVLAGGLPVAVHLPPAQRAARGSAAARLRDCTAGPGSSTSPSSPAPAAVPLPPPPSLGCLQLSPQPRVLALQRVPLRRHARHLAAQPARVLQGAAGGQETAAAGGAQHRGAGAFAAAGACPARSWRRRGRIAHSRSAPRPHLARICSVVLLAAFMAASCSSSAVTRPLSAAHSSASAAFSACALASASLAACGSRERTAGEGRRGDSPCQE